jgi:signal transduction histidine kinase/ActR/RegA family two-component response regulator
MKITYTNLLARKILLAFLLVTIAISVVALFVRNNINNKLARISKLAGNVENSRPRPEQILLLLHQAEDDFQSSLLNADSKRSADYKTNLSLAFKQIDTLLRSTADTVNLTSTERNKIKFSYHEKLKLSERLYELKHGFDSLLTVYADFNKESTEDAGSTVTPIFTTKKSSKNSSDTVQKNTPAQKKGLLKRIKEAIVNKDYGSKSVKEINHNNNTHTVDQSTQKILARDRNAYARKLQLLQQRNEKLLGIQRELIALNTRITGQLELIINEVKEIDYKLADQFRLMALQNYQQTNELLNTLYLVALALVLIFAVLLIIFINRLNKSEVLLRNENQRAVNIAQQKMDLLLHMSHEIRNPLTAIKGFLYIFSKSPLSERQGEMLDSIRLSSDMLLRTLNDTLDAAKMENSEFKINSDPFSPDFTLRNVIESMEFSAQKKGLEMAYTFNGNADTIVLGDGFRLEQVMVNLLSNAIKYTEKGIVTINAKLDADNKLHVDVSDTGMGISQEQQVNLFSKYYQTSSSKGKIGTGLGLYICKNLVELQSGKISVKSTQGAGTTFSFFIPYKKSSERNTTNERFDDSASLLNGVSILAVDDNELSLLFLKTMTAKWNVRFFQASNGQDALDIIAKNRIAIVLTDIQMPGMDGNDLLTAIQKLDGHAGKVPVIVIGGASNAMGNKKLLKKGFTGVISKPFKETELLEQLLNAINSVMPIAV